MVEIGRGQTRVVFWNIVGFFIQSDRSCLYRCCFFITEARCWLRANLQK